MKFTAVILITVWLFTFTASAQDSDSENTWSGFWFNLTYSGMGFSQKQLEQVDLGEIIHTTSVTTSGLMFSCVGGDLMVAVSLKPQNFRETFNKTTSRHKGRKVKLILDGGKKTDVGTWMLKPTLGGLASLKPYQAAKLYNAILRKQVITLQVQRHGLIELDIPPVNSEFREFG